MYVFFIPITSLGINTTTEASPPWLLNYHLRAHAYLLDQQEHGPLTHPSYFQCLLFYKSPYISKGAVSYDTYPNRLLQNGSNNHVQIMLTEWTIRIESKHLLGQLQIIIEILLQSKLLMKVYGQVAQTMSHKQLCFC